MSEFTWIKTHASVIIQGWKVVPIIAPFRIDPEWQERISAVAGQGERLWWRGEDLHRINSESQWGWSFEINDESQYGKMRRSEMDWEIDMWFRDANKAMLVKLSLPNPM